MNIIQHLWTKKKNNWKSYDKWTKKTWNCITSIHHNTNKKLLQKKYWNGNIDLTNYWQLLVTTERNEFTLKSSSKINVLLNSLFSSVWSILLYVANRSGSNFIEMQQNVVSYIEQWTREIENGIFVFGWERNGKAFLHPQQY